MKEDSDRQLTIRPQLDTSGIRSDWEKFVKTAHRTAADDYLDQVYGRLQQQQQTALNRRGLPQQVAASGGGMRGLGQASLQFQDIAVQAQAGTSAITILSQQGSQLASVFGPTGMIVGGVVAIGAALVTLSLKGRKDFEKLTAGAREFADETRKVIDNGTFSQIGEQIGKVIEKQRELASASAVDFWGNLSGGLLGKTIGEQGGERQNLDAQMDFQRLQLRERLVEMSREELELVRLRVAGKDLEVTKLERERQLEKEIAEIQRLRITDYLKEQLIANKTAAMNLLNHKDEMAAYEEKQKQDRQFQQEGQERLAKQRAPGIREEDEAARLRQQIRENGAESALRAQSPEDQAKTLRARAAELQRQGASFAGEVPEAEQLKLQIEINKLLERAKEIESDVSKRAATVAAAREQWDLEGQIAKARADAGGQESAKSKALEKQLRILQLQKTLMASLGLDAVQAAREANNRVNADEASAKAAEQRKQTEAKISIAKQAAITHARAHGHRTEANRLQREGEIEARAKDIEQQTGASPEAARAQAEAMQRDVDRLNGSRKIYGGKSKRGFEGIDGKSTPGLDAFKANQGKPLRDSFQFPGLEAFKANQRQLGPVPVQDSGPRSTPPQGGDAQARSADLLAELLQVFRRVDQKLTLAS